MGSEMCIRDSAGHTKKVQTGRRDMKANYGRRLRGSLEGNPEPGDRLRFVFVFVSCVACVRRARRSCGCVRGAECSSSRWPQLWEVLLLFATSLRSSGRGVRGGFKAKWVQICIPGRSLHMFYVGFMKVLHKTRVYGMGFMANPLKTHMWCISCRTHLIKTHV